MNYVVYEPGCQILLKHTHTHPLNLNKKMNNADVAQAEGLQTNG